MLRPSPDPDPFGEDLGGNLRDAVVVARRFCVDCADYHIIHSAVRLAGHLPAVAVDRDVIVDVIGGLLAGKPAADVVIAGSADAALLATAVAAARRALPSARSGPRFAVIDRCGTPLEFCRRFGERHGANVATSVGDLSEGIVPVRADVLLVHSLFRFLPIDRHARVLSALGRSLRPGGRIVFSQGIGAPGGAGPLVDRAKLLAMAESGAITLPEPLPDFLARLARQEASSRQPRADYVSESDLDDLFARAKLRVADRRLISRPESPQRRRLVAVLAAAQ